MIGSNACQEPHASTEKLVRLSFTCVACAALVGVLSRHRAPFSAVRSSFMTGSGRFVDPSGGLRKMLTPSLLW